MYCGHVTCFEIVHGERELEIGLGKGALWGDAVEERNGSPTYSTFPSGS